MTMTNTAGAPAVRAGNFQGTLLALLSLVSVAAALLLAPVLPSMVAHFSADPAAEQKGLMALAIPALAVAISAPLWGRIVDAIGRKRLLVLSLACYGLIGVAPAFLDDLGIIIGFRIALGIAEAAVMTASTTLIGDYFRGAEREKWLVFQTAAASVAGIFFLALGGIIGDGDWRHAFYVYLLALVAVPLCIIFLDEPSVHAQDEEPSRGFPWRRVSGLYIAALMASIMFFLLPIQVPFLLTAIGYSAPMIIGLTNAAGAIAVPLGAGLFRMRSSKPFWQNMFLAFLLMAIGFGIVSQTTNYALLLAGIVVGSLGAGVALPLMLTAIMERLPFDQRGRGTGGFQTAFFLGNFVSPIIVIALTAAGAGLSGSIGIIGIVALILALAAIGLRFQSR
jgi:MFS family permease